MTSLQRRVVSFQKSVSTVHVRYFLCVKHLSFSLSLSPTECIIKSLINPRNVAKMESTFGTWMKDTARLNDERIWVAEHFSGGLVIENSKDINLDRMSRLCVSKQGRPVGLQDLRMIFYRRTFCLFLSRSRGEGVQEHCLLPEQQQRRCGCEKVLPGLRTHCSQRLLLLSHRWNFQHRQVSRQCNVDTSPGLSLRLVGPSKSRGPKWQKLHSAFNYLMLSLFADLTLKPRGSTLSL